jgi:deoxyribose-phosphate aldolase
MFKEHTLDKDPTLSALARLIDHSLLHPGLTDREIEAGFLLARDYGVAAVCVKPYSVPAARDALAGSGVAVCAVAAFPHGNSTTALKIREAEAAIDDGGTEIGVVVNIGQVLSEAWPYVSAEIAAVNEAVIAQGALLKVIFENDFLEDRHIVRLCEICAGQGVAFVKTSTGYGFVKQTNGFYSYAGATEHAVKLMRTQCPSAVKIKAAGGLRTLDDLLAARSWGAERIGASATQTILEEARKRGYA